MTKALSIYVRGFCIHPVVAVFKSAEVFSRSSIHLTVKMKMLMKVRWKHWYCYLKKLLGLDRDDDVFDNPFVIL